MSDRSAKFWDKIAERYSKQPIADQAAYQKKLELTRCYLRSDSNVLEIGCGTGSTAIAHAPYVKHLHAVDSSANMIDIARDKAAGAKVDNISFEQASANAVAVADGSLDVVLALNVLHLLENKDEVIEQIYRMLKPGGVFVSSTICLADSSMRFLMPALAIGRWLGLVPLVKFFTAEQLEQSLRAAGFAIDDRWQPAKTKALFLAAKKPN